MDGVNTNEKKKRFITVPYVGGICEKLCRIYKKYNLRVCYTVFNKLDRFIKLGKDMLSNDVKTDVVYRINCVDCEACYVGQTKRHLSVRVKEHNLNIKKRDDDLSVVSRHRITNDHNFDWSNVNILHQEKHVRKREIAEMIFIRKQNNSINLQKDTECLPSIYD
ncbi:hypothetical protein X777_05489 [Ooceraea biroi]|uniref:GIY-YIG domain-containing protein n=1 Tax=Ooceraea biroi TaxID=2015173 RepID=A0A026WEI6_OOCBI|nr:hypothetical protein X777_05489 [Ooceraea biroi]